jgi:hypothetical protein
MRRFLASILMIAVVFVQSVSFSHVHPSCGTEVAGHHSGMPHFHVHGGHSHAAHRHESPRQSDEQKSLRDVDYPDHDADACFLPDSLASTSRLTTATSVRCMHLFTLAIASERFDHHAFVPQQRVGQLSLWSGSTARVPLYLQSLAILC